MAEFVTRVSASNNQAVPVTIASRYTNKFSFGLFVRRGMCGVVGGAFVKS